MRTAALLLGALTLAAGAPLQAKVARAPFAEMVRSADVIVIGTDSAVETGKKWNIAHFEVDEVLKGNPPTDLLYLASPTWTCDVATAKQGERSLLLLSLPDRSFPHIGSPPTLRKGQTIYQIAFSGRGRLPITQVEGVEHVTVWTVDVVLPSSIPTVAGPEPEFGFIQRAPLQAVRDTIDAVLAEPAN